MSCRVIGCTTSDKEEEIYLPVRILCLPFDEHFHIEKQRKATINSNQLFQLQLLSSYGCCARQSEDPLMAAVELHPTGFLVANMEKQQPSTQEVSLLSDAPMKKVFTIIVWGGGKRRLVRRDSSWLHATCCNWRCILHGMRIMHRLSDLSGDPPASRLKIRFLFASKVLLQIERCRCAFDETEKTR
jgi:hypothetical protein